MLKKTEKYQTCSVPDGETGQSGLTAILECLWRLALIIFWVKQSDTAWKKQDITGCKQHTRWHLSCSKRWCSCKVNTQTWTAGTLTDPQVVEPLAHGATLVWDLIEVLVETRLEGDESGQGREVVFWDTKTQFNAAAHTPKFIKKSSQDSCMQDYNLAFISMGW